ncbi:hypothetical protein PLICRDRAFT_39834 [Plicaturopsis crispa FD-325 SS-3]|nr:hypothetical protein PLICRDRAFT_39834 [Plicaturopsis crispa FD-325 SS-3]
MLGTAVDLEADASHTMSPTSPVYRFALEIWERVAFHAATDSFHGPPSGLVPLLCTSKALYNMLSFDKNPHLYREIFLYKFDIGAPSRRFSRRWLTSTCLAVELRKRFCAIKRIRHLVVDTDLHLSDLWTAYLMMMESDGKNESQLIEWADIPRFVRRAIHCRMETGAFLRDSEGMALTLWLLWMSDSRENIARFYPYAELTLLLYSFTARGYWYPSFYAPDSHFLLPLHGDISQPAPHTTGPPPKVAKITHYSHNLTIAAPSVTAPAFLALSVRYEYSQDVNPPPTVVQTPAAANTREDVLESHYGVRTKFLSRVPLNLNGANEPAIGSSRHDPDWYRLVSCHDPWMIERPLSGPMYRPGSLSGSWQGRQMVPDPQQYFSALVNPRSSNTLQLHSQLVYCTLREHHCISPDDPLSLGTDDTGEGDDILNAWFPQGTTVKDIPGEDAISVFDPVMGKETRYETFVPDRDVPYTNAAAERLKTPWVGDEDVDQPRTLTQADTEFVHGQPGPAAYIDDDPDLEDTVEHQSSGISDILVTGESNRDEAWGKYKYIGRVRPWDGLVVLLRMFQGNRVQARADRWIFKGYLHDGSLVGRWRETATGVGMIGLEGGFAMSKGGRA